MTTLGRIKRLIQPWGADFSLGRWESTDVKLSPKQAEIDFLPDVFSLLEALWSDAYKTKEKCYN